MTTLKVIPEEKPDINKVTACSLLDKSALSKNVFTKEECKRIIEIGRSWELVEAQIQTKNPEAESVKNDDYRNCTMYGPPVDKTAGGCGLVKRYQQPSITLMLKMVGSLILSEWQNGR